MVMRRTLIVLAFWMFLASVPILAQASAKTFRNCTALNKVYPGGVALPGAINVGGKTKFSPKYDKNLYLANQKSDRDKDGIACEK